MQQARLEHIGMLERAVVLLLPQKVRGRSTLQKGEYNNKITLTAEAQRQGERGLAHRAMQ
jgi:hypothetical protein